MRRALEGSNGHRGTVLLTSSGGGVSFNWQSEHWVDFFTYRSTAERILALPVEKMDPADAERLATAARLYTGDLLAGLDDDWVLYERERMRLLHLKSLRRLMEYMRATGRLDEGLGYALEIVRLDPLNEEIHRAIMRMYAWRGERSQALRHYESCRRALLEELGIEPMAETVALSRQIAVEADRHSRSRSRCPARSGRGARPGAAGDPPAGRRAGTACACRLPGRTTHRLTDRAGECDGYVTQV